MNCEAWTGRTHEVRWRGDFFLRPSCFYVYLVYQRTRFGIDDGEMRETYGFHLGTDYLFNAVGLFWHWKYDRYRVWAMSRREIAQAGGF